MKQSIERIGSMDIENEMEVKVKTEKIESKLSENKDELEEKRPKKHTVTEESINEISEPPPPAKIWRGLRYKNWSFGAMQPSTKFKKPTDREITEVNYRF